MNKIEEYANIIEKIANYLNIINSSFIATHLTGKISYGWVTYRKSENNWYSKVYWPILDEVAQAAIGYNKNNQLYYVTNSELRDYYLDRIIGILKKSFNGCEYVKEIDEPALVKCIFEWKKWIIENYNRYEHIKALGWQLLRTEYDTNIREKVYQIVRNILNAQDLNFDEFDVNGNTYTIIDYQHKEVRLDAMHGIFKNTQIYGPRPLSSYNKSNVVIDQIINHPYLYDLNIVEIGPNAFDSNLEVETITIPNTIKRIDWSFWKCNKLSSINISPNCGSQYVSHHYKSIDGVLYSGDGKILIAYPNNHGETYEIPNNVTSIAKFAFKSCKSIRNLFIPSSLTKIEVNAFYRCENLKRIICDMEYQKFNFEGFIGDYKPFEAQWFFISNVRCYFRHRKKKPGVQ
jgi:hypothetical protein